MSAAMSAMPARQAVQAVDEVQAVDHAHDPDHGERDPHRRGNGMLSDPNGLPMNGTVIPATTATPARHELAEELPACAQVEAVVERAEDRRQDRRRRTAPSELPAGEWPGRRDIPAASPGRGPGRRPRRRRRSRRRCRRRAGAADRGRGAGPAGRRSDAGRTTAGRGASTSSATSAATRNAATRTGTTAPADDDEAHPASSANRPGTGKRADDVARPRSRSRAARTAASSRWPDRVDDHPRDRAHLVGPEAARRRRRRARAGSRTRCSAARVERDRVLVDGDADLVEERLGLLAGDAERRHVDEHQVVVGAAARRCARRARPAPRRARPRSRPCAAGRAGTSLAAASLSATALPATTCISGPPWTPGNTALSICAPSVVLTDREVGAVDAVGEVLAAEDQAAARRRAASCGSSS